MKPSNGNILIYEYSNLALELQLEIESRISWLYLRPSLHTDQDTTRHDKSRCHAMPCHAMPSAQITS